MITKRAVKVPLLAITFAVTLATIPVLAQTFGMIVNNRTKKVVVFDADSDTVTGSVTIGSGSNGDCSISLDRGLGFATDFLSHVWAINLSPVGLATGINPIPIANRGEDTSLSPNGKHLVVCDGSALEPVSVIDIESRAQIGTLFGLPGCNSVDVASSGSVLVTSASGNVARLTIDSLGTLTSTGEVMSAGGEPNNVIAAPGGASGVVITRQESTVKSFTVPGLTPVDTRALSGFGISGVINPPGDRLFVRDNGGSVNVFKYDSFTGAIGATPMFSFPIAATPTFFGMDQMAIHPNGTKLYMSQPDAVEVYDTATGLLLNLITDAAISEPTGICLPGCTAPLISRASTGISSLWPPNHKLVNVTVTYIAKSNCLGTCTLGVTSNEPVNGTGSGGTGADWVIIDANHVQLRAEREATGTGRVYTITITCTNSTGQSSSTSLSVVVPHQASR
jgi:hypothetical protein